MKHEEVEEKQKLSRKPQLQCINTPKFIIMEKYGGWANVETTWKEYIHKDSDRKRKTKIRRTEMKRKKRYWKRLKIQKHGSKYKTDIKKVKRQKALVLLLEHNHRCCYERDLDRDRDNQNKQKVIKGNK